MRACVGGDSSKSVGDPHCSELRCGLAGWFIRHDESGLLHDGMALRCYEWNCSADAGTYHELLLAGVVNLEVNL